MNAIQYHSVNVVETGLLGEILLETTDLMAVNFVQVCFIPS